MIDELFLLKQRRRLLSDDKARGLIEDAIEKSRSRSLNETASVNIEILRYYLERGYTKDKRTAERTIRELEKLNRREDKARELSPLKPGRYFRKGELREFIDREITKRGNITILDITEAVAREKGVKGKASIDKLKATIGVTLLHLANEGKIKKVGNDGLRNIYSRVVK